MGETGDAERGKKDLGGALCGSVQVQGKGIERVVVCASLVHSICVL